MTAPIEETTVTFENLISTCKEAQARFRSAAAAAEDKAIRRLLGIYAQQRTRFAEELLQEMGSPSSASRQAGDAGAENGLTAQKSPSSDLDLLRECLKSESRALESYKDALGARIPTRAHFLVAAQHQLMQRAHERMQGMLATPRGSSAAILSSVRTAL